MGTLRMLLAISVVLVHAGHPGVLVGGRNSVQLFYVISGFLMSQVIVESRSYRSAGAFYLSRWLRLYPIYAVVALATLAFYQVFPNRLFFATWASAPASVDLLLAVSNGALFLQDWLMFMGVQDGHLHFMKNVDLIPPQLWFGLVVPPAWTLGLELSFYLLAPFLLPRRKWIWIALAASLALRGVFILWGFGLELPWDYRFFPTELALFLLGSLSHQILAPRYRRLTVEWQDRASKWAVAGLVVALASYASLPLSEAGKTLFTIGAFVVLAPLAFDFQRRFAWDNFIGSLSYPVYICHWLVLFAMRELFARHRPPKEHVTLAVATVLCSIAIAFLLERYVGAPVEALRSRIRTRARAGPSFDPIAPPLPSARPQG